jgi:serralysin
MLWALALLGILPAAFVFGDSGENDSVEDVDGNDLSAGDDSTALQNDSIPDILDDTDVDDEVQDSASAQPVHHDAVSNGAEITFDDFAEGEDAITLHLTNDGSGDFIVEPLQDADGETLGVSLSYLDGDTETTLNFPGLIDVPAQDITIGITSQDTGEETLYNLEEIGDFGALDPDDPDAPAVPNGDEADDPVAALSDPDAPAVPSGQGDPDDPIVTPDMPDDEGQVFDHVLADGGDTLVLDDDPFQGGFEADIVTTGDTSTIETDHALHRITGSDDGDTIVLGDDAAIVQGGSGDDSIMAGEGTAIVYGGAGDDAISGGDDSGSDYLFDGGGGDDDLSGGEAAEILIGGLGADSISGGGGDDTLILDSQDIATGGAGEDTFWLYSDGGADDDFALITDFSKGKDVIRISLPPEAEQSGDFDIDVTQTEDGTGSQVSINGDVVAVLYGAPNVTAGDIVVDYSA